MSRGPRSKTKYGTDLSKMPRLNADEAAALFGTDTERPSKLDAIKLYRTRTNCGLAEAVDVMTAAERGDTP